MKAFFSKSMNPPPRFLENKFHELISIVPNKRENVTVNYSIIVASASELIRIASILMSSRCAVEIRIPGTDVKTTLPCPELSWAATDQWRDSSQEELEVKTPKQRFVLK